MNRVATAIYNSLLRNDVKIVNAYSGGSIMGVIDSFYESKDIKFVVNSNEQCVGHCATGVSKTSKQTGVAIVTSGPGITNMVTPMLDATNDSTPLVVISGQVSRNAIGTNAFQEAAATEITKPVTKWSYQITDPNDISYIIDKAFYIANEGKKGAVHIDIPKCVSMATTNNNKTFKTISDDENKKLFNFDFHDFCDAIRIINNSKKPILYVGQGCKESYKLLRTFAQKANIPVTTTIHGCGIMDENDPLSLGWCGMHGYENANYCIQKADCIIAIGSRFDDRTTGNLQYYAPEAFRAQKNGTGGFIHVNIEPSEIRKIVDTKYNFNINCSQFLSNSLPFIKYNPRKQWIDIINYGKKRYQFKENKNKDKLFMENVLLGLYNKTLHFKDNVIFTTGVGNHQMQTYQYIKSHYPNKIISSGSLGVMGSGLPYAIGAQLANPTKTVVCVDGDSSFNMTSVDLKTVKEHNIPIKIAIMNNNSQMMVECWEKLFFRERYTATQNECNPSYTKLANSYGIESIECNSQETLEQKLDYFLNYEGPILCEFKIKKDMCFPLVPPNSALDKMITFESYNEEYLVSEIPS